MIASKTPRTERAEERRRYKRKWEADRYRTASEVPEIPPPVNPERRAACGESLELYLTTYFPESTGLGEFSDDHKRVIARLEGCLRKGGRQANCVYRGFAKTTITENSAMWGGSYGLRDCLLLIGAADTPAKLLLDSIRTEFLTNDLLLEDFPEICIPIRQLENKPQRCASQRYGPTGELTYIGWSSDEIVLPIIDVPWSKAGGAVIMCRGIKAASRGISIKHPKGHKLRPDFALGDDLQTDESAASPTEVEKRLSTFRRGVLKSSSHQKTIACVVNGTAIQPDDVMDQLCDRDRNPAWETERIPMVKSWADAHDALWQEYRKLRHGFDPELVGDRDRAHRAATDFYLAHREEMDAGCVVSWDQCFDPETEVSAIQHAYNLWFDDPEDVFESECQQNPKKLSDDNDAPKMPSAGEIAKQINGVRQGIVPEDRDLLTAFIDVGDSILFWTVMAFSKDGFAGDVVDYGAWPDQKRLDGWTARGCPKPICRAYPFRKRLVAMEDAIDDCIASLIDRNFRRVDGAEMRLEQLLIDVGHEATTVETCIRKSPFGGRVVEPCKGVGIGAKKKPMREYRKDNGVARAEVNDHWRRYRPAKRTMLWIESDVNHWKSFIRDSLEARTMRLFGKSAERHRLFAQHISAEQPTRMKNADNGRVVDEWDVVAKSRDNHWLDCMVGCCVAAAIKDARPAGASRPVKKPQPRLSLSELRERSRKTM